MADLVYDKAADEDDEQRNRMSTPRKAVTVGSEVCRQKKKRANGVSQVFLFHPLDGRSDFERVVIYAILSIVRFESVMRLQE